MRKIATTFIAGSLILLSAQLAFAHATPVMYEPGNGAMLSQVPAEVKIVFSERIEEGASSITVYAPDGSEANAGRPVVDPADRHNYSAAVSPRGQGTYTVSWRVVSADDGHFTKGAFSFSVGASSTPVGGGGEPELRVVHSSAWPEAITIGFDLLGQAILLASLVLLAAWRKGQTKYPELREKQGVFSKHFAILVTLGCLFIIGGSKAYIWLRSLELQSLSGGGFWESVQAFAGTSSGSFTIYRAIAALVFLILFWIWGRRIAERSNHTNIEWAFLLLLIFMAFTRARISHAAASHLWPEFSIFVNWVHILFKELWIGGVAVFTWIWLVLGQGKDKLTNFFLACLSRVAMWALLVGGITGTYIVWLHLKSPANVFTTEWGKRFFVLSLWAVVLLALRLYHQLVVERKLAARIKNSESGESKLVSSLKLSLPLETLVAIIVLFSSSLMIITTPPLSQGGVFERSASSQGAHVMLTEKENAFYLEIHGNVTIQKVVVTLTNEEKGIGPIVVDAPKSGFGYDIPKAVFTPPGVWKLDINAQKTQGYDVVAGFTIDYPKELVALKTEGPRESGAFEGMIMLSIIAIAVLARILYKRNYMIA